MVSVTFGSISIRDVGQYSRQVRSFIGPTLCLTLAISSDCTVQNSHAIWQPFDMYRAPFLGLTPLINRAVSSDGKVLNTPGVQEG